MLINGKFRCAGCMSELKNEFGICSCGYNNDTDVNLSHCLQTGAVLSDEYIIGRVIGEGGFGITYVGWDKNLDKKVAIKEFYLSGFSSRNATVSYDVFSHVGEETEIFELNREKFINEAKVLASFIDEPGIVTVHRFFRENNTAYIVMEYLDGITLKEYLRKKGKMTVDETIGIIGPVMNSLAKIHEKNLIHRDISPDNIMITADGRGKLIDFGAAREVNGGNKSLSVVLKHGFAPLEQYQSHGNQGPWTDVYALSATIYRCITGNTPTEATDRVLDDALTPLCEIEPACSQAVSRVIDKGLSIRIDDRYQSVGDFKNALISALNNGEDISSTDKKVAEGKTTATGAEKSDSLHNESVKNSSGTKTEKKKRKSKAPAVIIFVSVLAIAALIVFFATDLFDNVRKETELKQQEQVSEDENETITVPIESAEIGDTILFGNTGEFIDGFSQYSNKWTVLDKKDGKILVINSYINIENEAPQSGYDTLVWSVSRSRKLLNGKYLSKGFSEEERRQIAYTLIPSESDIKTDPFYENGVLDQIFLLSYDEVIKYFPNGDWGTISVKGDTAGWDTRSIGTDGIGRKSVNGNNEINEAGTTYSSVEKFYFRPAMWIYADSVAKENDVRKGLAGDSSIEEIMATQAGEVVKFGNYNGCNEWYVLENQGDKCLLISRYIIDKKQYNLEEGDTDWKNCSLREWLNSDYIELAFSEEEQGYILEAEHELPIKETHNEETHSVKETVGNEVTIDRVFLLRQGEKKPYYECLFSMESGWISASANSGIMMNWWTRSPGTEGNSYVYTITEGRRLEALKAYAYQGVRPTIWITAGD